MGALPVCEDPKQTLTGLASTDNYLTGFTAGQSRLSVRSGWRHH
jgi:hypothetical protein